MNILGYWLLMVIAGAVGYGSIHYFGMTVWLIGLPLMFLMGMFAPRHDY